MGWGVLRGFMGFIFVVLMSMLISSIYSASITTGSDLWKPSSPLDVKLINYSYDRVNNSLKLLFMLEYPHPQYRVVNITMWDESETVHCIDLGIIAYTGPTIQVVTYDYLSITLRNISSPWEEHIVKLYINGVLKYMFRVKPLQVNTTINVLNTTTTTTSMEEAETTTTKTMDSTTTLQRTTSTNTSRMYSGGGDRFELIVAFATIFILLIVLGGILYLKK